MGFDHENGRSWPAVHVAVTPDGLTPTQAWRALLAAGPAERAAAATRFSETLAACSFDCSHDGGCAVLVLPPQRWSEVGHRSVWR